LEWPFLSAAGAADRVPGRAPAQPEEERRGSVPWQGSDFTVECYTRDIDRAQVGVPPYPPLAQLPITLGAQARSRAADEYLTIAITEFTVMIVKSR
jgi:hypothetical protein